MKIGIMSFAHIHAENYTQILKNRNDVKVIGFYDDDAKRGKEFSEKYLIPFFTDKEAFFAEKPDAVIICCENNRHRKFAEEAAANSCSVLCEKPLATSVEDARYMVDLFHKKNLLLMTAFPMRYAAPVVEAKKIIDEQVLGKIYSISSMNQGRMPGNLRSWFVDRKLAGGGALTDHLVHLVDIFRWIFHKEVSEVFALCNRNLHVDIPNLDVETGALVMISLEDGPFISIDCSWSRPQGYPTWGTLSFEMIGHKGNVTIDAFAQVSRFYSPVSIPEWKFWGTDANRLMIDDFIESHKKKRIPRVNGIDGLKAVAVVEAAYRSIETGQKEEPHRL